MIQLVEWEFYLAKNHAPPPPASPKNEVLLWDFEPPSLNKAFFFLAKGGIGG